MVVLDIETKSFFNDPGDGSVRHTSELGISFAGAYNAESDAYLSFWEKDLPELEELLKKAKVVVGYNIWAFDYGVLAEYVNIDPWTLPTIDLMVAMKKTVGFRPKLDDLARANLGTGKIGRGVDATVYWQSGELEKLEKYCLEDVRLTYEVWKAGESGMIKYFDQSGFIRETAVNWRDGFIRKVPEDVQGRLV